MRILGMGANLSYYRPMRMALISLRESFFCISGIVCIFMGEARAQDALGTPTGLKISGTQVVTDRPGTSLTGMTVQKDAPLVPVKADNPDKKIVDGVLDELRNGYGASKEVGARVYDALQVESQAANTIFPGYRFYLIAWDEFYKSPMHTAIGLGMDIHYILALDPRGGVEKLQGDGVQVLLKDAHVVIRSQEKAELVWKALGGALRYAWEGKCVKVSDTEWKLGIYVFEDHRGEPLYRTTTWWDVKTDADGLCISATTGRTEIILNADPAVQHEVTLQIPTKLETSPDPFRSWTQLVLKEKKNVKVMVGANMLTGVRTRLYIYPEGEKRPEKPFQEIVGRISLDFSPGGLGMDTGSSGFSTRGKNYVCEVESVLFETDIPYGDPAEYVDGKYREIWKQWLKIIAPVGK